MEEMSFERDVLTGSRVYRIMATALPDGRTSVCLRSGLIGSPLNELSGVIAKEDLAMVADVVRPELAAIAAWYGIPFDDPTQVSSRRRRLHPNAYAPWTAAQEQKLLELHRKGMPVTKIAKELGRRPGGIEARLEKLFAEADIDAPETTPEHDPQEGRD
jgi:hypothetical protein